MKWLFRSLGLIIFIVILSRIEIPQTVKIIRHIHLEYLFLTLFLLISQVIIKVWRWQLILKTQAIYYKLRDCLSLYWIGLYLSIITPGKIGDFIRVLYLKKDKHPLIPSFFTVLSDRAIDLSVILLCGLVSIFIALVPLRQQIIFSSLVILAFILGAIWLWHHPSFFKKLLALIVFPKYRERIRLTLKDFVKILKGLKLREVLNILVVAFLGWGVYFVSYYFLAKSLTIDLPLLKVIVSLSLATLVTLLPISISGLGTRDATLIFLFSQWGLSSESAIAFSVTILITNVGISLLGLIPWLNRPLKI